MCGAGGIPARRPVVRRVRPDACARAPDGGGGAVLLFGAKGDAANLGGAPLLSYTRDPDTESKEFDFLYPVMTYDRYGDQYRWQFFQLLSFAGGPTQQESARDRFTLFPLYFQQRSSDPSENYTAVFPFYGHLKHRLFRDEIFFVMFPLYSETRKKDVVTDNYLWPFFHLRHGDGLHGWQFWPLVGNEHKDVTTQTNGFNEVKTIGGHDSFFALWPLFFNNKSGIGTTNAQWQQASIPAYSLLRSPLRDSTTVIWPFFNYVDDREKKYREWDAPWPLIVFARGEGKTTTRVWPFFSQAHNATLESDFYLWPIYKYNRVHSAPLDSRRTRICFFLYSDLTEKNTETEAARRRVDFWPFFTYRRDFNGNSRLQVLALLEPFLSSEQEHRARLLAALVGLAFREESAGRRHQPIAAVEPVSARNHTRRQKMLAPVRSFPVSIQSRRQAYALVLYSFGQDETRRRAGGAHPAPAKTE